MKMNCERNAQCSHDVRFPRSDLLLDRIKEFRADGVLWEKSLHHSDHMALLIS
jgi:hypothetical protein